MARHAEQKLNPEHLPDWHPGPLHDRAVSYPQGGGKDRGPAGGAQRGGKTGVSTGGPAGRGGRGEAHTTQVSRSKSPVQRTLPYSTSPPVPKSAVDPGLLPVARRITEARVKKGWTQLQLGRELGVTKNCVTQWETGRNAPSFGRLSRLCDVLGISETELLTGETAEQRIQSRILEQQAVDMLRRMDPRTQSQALQMLSVLAPGTAGLRTVTESA